jgi:UDP-N-acetyl-D-galactosamine dehydrogenase
MGLYVAAEAVRRMVKSGISMPTSRILVLGFTFKEDCPDVRNTRVVDVIRELQQYGGTVDIVDPWADPDEVMAEYGISTSREIPATANYDGIILAVAHRQFREMTPAAIHALGKPGHVVYDIKSVLPANEVDGRL